MRASSLHLVAGLDKTRGLRLHRMMRGVLQTLALGAGLGSLVMLLAACGGTVRSGDNSSTTTQETYGVTTPDPPPKQNTEWDRLSAHQGSILASVHIRVVYVGTENEGLAPNQDEFMKWLVTSEYWGTLKQYGIGNGAILDSVSVPREELAPTALLQPDKLIAVQDLDLRVSVMVNGSATEAPYPGVAGADGYVIFLPDGLNVELSHRADYTSKTCIDEGGYHAHDGTEPYVIVPPCDKGRSTVAISHEITEMVTDPLPAAGWLSDGDVSKNGGEIADLCNHSIQVESRDVTQLWSNSDGECMPYEP